ncbi:MAG: L-fucose isomerase [Spirochaeta sp. LUC14_002_19_P3]|nr:MAG: L-fucose isomerase [Spirochaeta sp. LUC14_002_19_P3]
MQEAKIGNWRYADEKPKIGIRPAIDGRLGGVRESLEARTMDMARAAARLISENLKYIDGTPVQCVIADTCIGGVREAAAARAKFEADSVGASLTVTPCWCYGSETMDTTALIPKAVWGFNGTERPGAVYLAAVLSAHAQKGLPAFGIYGRHVQDSSDTSIPGDVKEKILRFARAAVAAACMRGKSYLSIGSVSMGIAGCIIDESFFRNYLDMRNEYVDMSEVARRIKDSIYDEAEYERAKSWVKENLKIGRDPNPADEQHDEAQKQAEWDESIKMTLIVRDLMEGNPRLAEKGLGEEALGHNAIAAGFQGQRQWTDWRANGDFMETMLNSSFDWNGIRAPYIMATENDSLNGISMLFGHLLTNTAQLFSDVRTYWSPEAVKRVTGHELSGPAAGGIIHLINSGSTCLDGTGEITQNGKPAMKPFWELTPAEAQACMDATRFCPADLGYFRGGGFSTDFLTRGGMPCTMSRINLIAGMGPVLQIAEGWTVDLPQKVHDTLDERTNPTWPTTWFAPRLTSSGNFQDVYGVMAAWGANHGAISCGHIGADLITLASILRIPVSMHNLAQEHVFRPAVWNHFGMNSEGADYRACANFGPLYR